MVPDTPWLPPAGAGVKVRLARDPPSTLSQAVPPHAALCSPLGLAAEAEFPSPRMLKAQHPAPAGAR